MCVSPDPRTQQHDTRRTVRDVQRGEAKHRAVGAARRRNLRRKPNIGRSPCLASAADCRDLGGEGQGSRAEAAVSPNTRPGQLRPGAYSPRRAALSRASSPPLARPERAVTKLPELHGPTFTANPQGADLSCLLGLVRADFADIGSPLRPLLATPCPARPEPRPTPPCPRRTASACHSASTVLVLIR